MNVSYKKFLYALNLIALGMVMSGCNRVMKWGSERFVQADVRSKDDTALLKGYLRSQKVYNQFSTAGEFAALLLSDAVRTAYVDYYGYAHFKSEKEKETMLMRLLKENDSYISFYVVCSERPVEYRDGYAMFKGEYHRNYTQMLGMYDADWRASLKIGDLEFKPLDIKKVELPMEYRVLFKTHFNQFKQVYLLKFDHEEIKNSGLLEDQAFTADLMFRSADKQVTLSWKDISYEE